MQSFELQRKIIDIYSTIIIKYIDTVNHLTFMPDETDYDCMLYTGIIIIQRTFEYVLIKLKSLENAHHFSQKAYVYFIEYMEQINQNGLSQHFNRNDVILFVYKKTILCVNSNDSNEANTMNNILSLNDTNEYYCSDECIKLLTCISTFTNRLLCWENSNITTDNRISICQQYLQLYLPQRNEFINHVELVSIYLGYIHNKIQIEYTMYCELLNEIYKAINTTTLNIVYIEPIYKTMLVKFRLEDAIFYKKIKANDMKDFVRWLYAPISL